MNPFQLPEPKSGKVVRLKSETYEQLVSTLRALWSGKNVVAGRGVLKREFQEGGFSLSCDVASRGGAIESHPFQIKLAPSEDADKRVLNVAPGLIDRVYPLMGGEPLWKLPAPSIEIDLPPNGRVRNIYIASTVVAGRITSPTIATALDNAMPAETDSATHYVLGYVEPNGNVVQLVRENISYQAFSIVFDVGSRLIQHLYNPQQ
jgi:hypothetical protein